MSEQPPKYTWDSFGWFMVDWHSPGQKDIAAARGIARTEAATVFADPASLTFRDPHYPDDAARFVTVGISYRRRFLRVQHTDTVEHGPSRDSPEKLLVRIDDAEDVEPAADTTHPSSDAARGTRGRYAELYEAGPPVTYMDESERYWFNVPARTYQTCLWWVKLEKVRSDPAPSTVELTLDIERIRKQYGLSEDLRFILRLEGVDRVRAYHEVVYPSGESREETLSWPDFEAAVDGDVMGVEETHLVWDEEADTGLFLDMDGLLYVPGPHGNPTENVTFRIHARSLRVLRTDGVPCSLEALDEMGNAEFDATHGQGRSPKRT